MKKIILLMFLLLFSLSFCLAHDEDKSHYVYLQDPNDLINPNGFYEYMIIKNDHLSHLAYKFYYDGLKWTRIYKANPYIIDPNWIYPDNWLVIPDIYSDEDGNPITKERSFIYKSNDTIITGSVPKSGIAQDNGLFPKDKSDDSQVYTNNEEDIDKTIPFKIETQDIEIDEQLENILEESKSVVTSSTDKNRKSSKYEKTSTYKNPNWVIGLHGGYPFGEDPDEEDNPYFGLLIGTPLRITLGPLSARLGAGFLGYDFTDKLYPGAGVLLNLAISELLKWTTPVQLQVHGTGFYVPDGGVGTGIFASTSVPLGDSPFNIGLYFGVGIRNNSDSVKSNWKNTGLLLQLQL